MKDKYVLIALSLMAMEKLDIPITLIIKVNGIMESFMEKESSCGLMVLPMKGTISEVRNMELGLLSILPARFIREVGKMANSQEKEHCLMKKVSFLNKGNG